jgi:hypothetical protein
VRPRSPAAVTRAAAQHRPAPRPLGILSGGSLLSPVATCLSHSPVTRSPDDDSYEPVVAKTVLVTKLDEEEEEEQSQAKKPAAVRVNGHNTASGSWLYPL